MNFQGSYLRMEQSQKYNDLLNGKFPQTSPVHEPSPISSTEYSHVQQSGIQFIDRPDPTCYSKRLGQQYQEMRHMSPQQLNALHGRPVCDQPILSTINSDPDPDTDIYSWKSAIQPPPTYNKQSILQQQLEQRKKEILGDKTTIKSFTQVDENYHKF